MLETLKLITGGMLIMRGLWHIRAAHHWRDNEEKYWREYDASSSNDLTLLRLTASKPTTNSERGYGLAVRRLRLGGVQTALLGIIDVLWALSDLGVLNIRD